MSDAAAGVSRAAVLRLRGRTFPAGRPVLMAVVNRTPDSFYDRGETYALGSALDRVDRVVAEGADIVDIGGVPAGQGDDVGVGEELRRTQRLVAAAREHHPELVLSVDTWRAEVADVLCREGADLVNDSWAGVDPRVAEVAAEHGAGLVCSHTGGMEPRTDPQRNSYSDVVADVIATTTSLAARAVEVGVRRDGIVVDPTHDFGKNTYHSLELTRRLDELVATGWPVLVALSNKDFVGETLDQPVADRLYGTLAATAVAAWHGVRVFRTHQVAETRQLLDMVASIRGDRPPARPRRGLA